MKREDVMLNEIKKMPVNRTLIAVAGTVILPIVTIFIITTIYAFKLAFEVHGQPDETLISQFAENLSSWLAPVMEIILTFLGVKWIQNKVPEVTYLSGLFFAIIVVAIGLIFHFAFGEAFHLTQLLWIALVLIVGALAGFTGKKAGIME